MKKEIWDYFDDTVDYPENIAFDPIPWNTCWCYVSKTFLNGFINYIEPIGVFVIDRYTSPGTILKYKDDSFTKSELINKAISGTLETNHTDLSCFHDDLVVLGSIGENSYMFMWFDCDTSDCVIGRFNTEDTVEQVVESVRTWLETKKQPDVEWAEHIDNGIVDYHELPVSFIKGWVSF